MLALPAVLFKSETGILTRGRSNRMLSRVIQRIVFSKESFVLPVFEQGLALNLSLSEVPGCRPQDIL